MENHLEYVPDNHLQYYYLEEYFHGQKYYEDQLDKPFNIIKVEFEEYFPTIYKYFKEYFLMNGNIWKTISMWTERLGRSS